MPLVVVVPRLDARPPATAWPGLDSERLLLTLHRRHRWTLGILLRDLPRRGDALALAVKAGRSRASGSQVGIN